MYLLLHTMDAQIKSATDYLIKIVIQSVDSSEIKGDFGQFLGNCRSKMPQTPFFTVFYGLLKLFDSHHLLS